MLILAIESSCDETAVAVVKDGREVLSSEVLSQIDIHKLYGGVVPEIASRQHIEAISFITQQAVDNAGIKLSDIDAIAVTFAPGLIGALLVGVNFAKGLSLSLNIPLIPVHHIRAHIAANYIDYPDLTPQFLSLVVSGGHSHIVQVLDYTKFKVLGRTRDDAVGEVFDKVARVLGFGYPGGIQIDNAAKTGNPNAFIFPKPKLDTPLDFSFSGVKTSVINLIHNITQKGEVFNKNDIAASFQKTVVDILTEKLFLAVEMYNAKKIVIAGGVCANSGLRERLLKECEKMSIPLYMPSLSLCGDNAAMVGTQGYYEYLSGNIADLSLNAVASMEME